MSHEIGPGHNAADTKFAQIAVSAWGHKTKEVTAEQIVERLIDEVREGIAAWEIDCFENELANDNDGFHRAFINLPIGTDIFELFFNSRSGYRAQYAHGDVDADRKLTHL